MLSTPASTCLSEANDPRDPGGAATAGIDAQLASDVATAVNPAARAKSRREIISRSCHRTK
jgi:hypothetical protein